MLIEALRTDYTAGFESAWHSSEFAQLIYPSEGVMTLHLKRGICVIPSVRAYWLPPFEQHKVTAESRLQMHSVYCSSSSTDRGSRDAGMIQVSSLLRATILALEAARGKSNKSLRHLALVFKDEIAIEQSSANLSLPSLSAGRLAPIAAALRRNPGDGRTLQKWAQTLGTTPRTLSRAFQRDAHMSFRHFREQLRLHEAMVRLAKKRPVTSVAHDLGFGSASAFIASFRRATERTPGTYFSAGLSSPSGGSIPSDATLSELPGPNDPKFALEIDTQKPQE